MIPQGGKVRGREVKWKTPTNWKSGTEVVEGIGCSQAGRQLLKELAFLVQIQQI